MNRSRLILDSLGREGIERAVCDAFDRAALVRAVNACKVPYPGRRAQSVASPNLAADLTRRALEDSDAAVALVKALERACAAEIRLLKACEEPRIEEAISSLVNSGAVGRAVFALAVDGRPASRSAVARLLKAWPAGAVPAQRSVVVEGAGSDAPRSPDESSEILALRKQAHAFEAKARRLAEENARLHEREIHLAGRLEELEKSAPAGSAFSALATGIHHSLRENEKALHDIREALAARLPAPAEGAKPYIEALAATVRALQGEIGDLRAEREADRKKDRDALGEMSKELHAVKSELSVARGPAAEKPPRRKGDLPRVGLFVDVQNMYYAARQLNARLDFQALIESVTHERRLIRAIAYVVQNRDIDQSGFLAMLQQRNYEVRQKELRVRADGSSKGDWDMGMALDILDLAPSLDIVVLATGDGDFVPLVNRVKQGGPRVEVYSFPGSTAKELIEACDRHIQIDEGLLRRNAPAF